MTKGLKQLLTKGLNPPSYFRLSAYYLVATLCGDSVDTTRRKNFTLPSSTFHRFPRAYVACVPSRLRLHASFFRPSTQKEGASKTSWLRAWLLNMASRRRLCGTSGACVRGRKRQDRSGRMRKGNDFLARSYAPTAPALVFRQFRWHVLHAVRSYHARRRRRSVLQRPKSAIQKLHNG